MARTTSQKTKTSHHTAAFLGFLSVLGLFNASCGSFVTPDSAPASAIQVTARIELAHRSAWLEQVERETQALLDHLSRTQRGFDRERNQAIVRKIVTVSTRGWWRPLYVSNRISIRRP